MMELVPVASQDVILLPQRQFQRVEHAADATVIFTLCVGAARAQKPLAGALVRNPD
jgi:hypothetical protein